MLATSWRGVLLRAAIGAALVGCVAGLDAARAQTYGSSDVTDGTAWNKLLQSLGLRSAVSSSSGIDYSERSPLVVPRTRDLPPPVASTAVSAPDWPKDAAKPVDRPKPKPGVIPGTAVQTPNPPVQKKPWYNPIGWFDKEEYAKFAGEPARANLTDPPAGYRVPSAEQPYGISPDKKPYKPTAKDFNMNSATPGK